MNKKLIVLASTLMIGLFTVAGFAGVVTTNNATSTECVIGEDCDKCGKKDCKGDCENKSAKKECTSAKKKACCSKSAKKSCGTKAPAKEEEKKN